MTNKHLGSEKVNKIISLLSQSEKVAVERGQALHRALINFDRLGKQQKAIAVEMLNQTPLTEIDGDGRTVIFLHDPTSKTD